MRKILKASDSSKAGGKSIVKIPNNTSFNAPILAHGELLIGLLEKITPVDFREAAGFKNEDDKLKTSHLLIITVEKLIQVAQDNNWGLCTKYESIYLFNGCFWALFDVKDFKNFLGEVAEKMGVDKFRAKEHRFREELYKQFLTLSNLPAPTEQDGIVLINMLNGTFEISPTQQKLREYQREDFLTYQLPFEYNEQAKAPVFEKYLNEVLPDKEAQKVLGEFLGYVFISPGTLKLEKALLLYGTGANGKSVFFDIVNALLDEQNISNYSLQSITKIDGYQRAELANKLLNYSSEINGNIEAQIFKQLASGEKVEARQIYGKPFIFIPKVKLIFNCNELPKDVEHTDAYFRRFLIIPFTISIPNEKQDKELAKKIIANELSGVFNWVLQGLNRLLTNKRFTECEAINKQLEQYKKVTDNVALFLEETGYRKSSTEYVTSKDLYIEYRTFCADDGYRPLAKSNFKQRLMQTMKVLIERKNVGQVVFLIKEQGF